MHEACFPFYTFVYLKVCPGLADPQRALALDHRSTERGGRDQKTVNFDRKFKSRSHRATTAPSGDALTSLAKIDTLEICRAPSRRLLEA